MTQRHCPGRDCDRPTSNILCHHCVAKVERQLRDLPALAAELEVTISRQGVGAHSGHRKKGDDQPLPFNADASSKRALVDIIVEWSDLIAQRSGVPGLPLRPTIYAHRARADRAAKLIIDNIGWFRVDPQAPDAADAIWYIRNQLRAAINRPPERTWAGPCHAPLPATIHEQDGVISIDLAPAKCKLDVWRKWGEDLIVCDGYVANAKPGDPQTAGGCGAIHEVVPGRVQFLKTAIEDELLPLRLVWESLYVLLPDQPQVAWETARKWGRPQRIQVPVKSNPGKTRTVIVPPRLTERSRNALGVPLFRGGDILALAADVKPRTGRRRIRTRGKVSA